MRQERIRSTLSWLSWYFASLALVLWLAETWGNNTLLANTAPACPACKTEWVGQLQLLGALECGHGPEHDQDCKNLACYPNCDWNKECKELNGGKGNCECFTCAAGRGCEEEIQYWEAWCTTANGSPCNTQADTDGPNFRHRAASVPGGAACQFGTNGFQQFTYCGGAGGASLSCKSTNGCDATGVAWTTTNGSRRKCS